MITSYAFFTTEGSSLLLKTLISSVCLIDDIKDKYDLITDKKREKARERLEVVIAQKEKIEARVLKYQQAIIESKTDKQKEKAEQSLAKAMDSLESALKKVADAQVQYEIWVNQ